MLETKAYANISGPLGRRMDTNVQELSKVTIVTRNGDLSKFWVGAPREAIYLIMYHVRVMNLYLGRQ